MNRLMADLVDGSVPLPLLAVARFAFARMGACFIVKG